MNQNRFSSKDRKMELLGIYNLSKSYGTEAKSEVVFDNFSLEINQGEKVSILGASGCGKTTLLNIIAGIDKIADPQKFRIKTNQRIGYMFQNDRLLPWRRARNNALLGLEMLGKKITTDHLSKVSGYFQRFQMNHDEEKYPKELSGGMRQKVALMRTMLYDPSILLLDEPFSGLDYHTKHFLEKEMLQFVHEKERTMIFVTHDPIEAIAVANRVVVLSRRSHNSEPTEILLDEPISFTSDRAGRDPVIARTEPEFSSYEKLVLGALAE